MANPVSGHWLFTFCTVPGNGCVNVLSGCRLCAQGLATPGELADEFRDVSRAARTLGMLPAGGVGPVSMGLSKLAARLKVSVTVNGRRVLLASTDGLLFEVQAKRRI